MQMGLRGATAKTHSVRSHFLATRGQSGLLFLVTIILIVYIVLSYSTHPLIIRYLKHYRPFTMPAVALAMNATGCRYLTPHDLTGQSMALTLTGSD